MSVTALPQLDPGPLVCEARRQGFSHEVWAERAGLDVKALRRRIYEPLTWGVADRLACAMDVHPASVWGDDWWAVDKAAQTAQERRDERAVRYEWWRSRGLHRGAWKPAERSWAQWAVQRERWTLHNEEWA